MNEIDLDEAILRDLVMVNGGLVVTTSLAGKTLRRWQVKGPVIEQKIIEVEREGQLQLFHA
ncbi:hypothetical protein ACV33P_19665 [Pseudomonas aeruginosa]